MTARLDDPSFKLTGSAALSLIGGVAGNRHCADCGAREPEWYACVRVLGFVRVSKLTRFSAACE